MRGPGVVKVGPFECYRNGYGSNRAVTVQTSRFVGICGRGRDMSYLMPPAQIPASGITTPGSYLELWQAKKRSSGQGCRTLGCGSQRFT